MTTCSIHHGTFRVPPRTSLPLSLLGVYNLDGQLIGAPEMSRTTGFDTSDIRLPNLPVEIWQEFIFVNLSSDPAPLAPKLHKLNEALANYKIDQLITVDPAVIPDVPLNWKIMIENFMEMYHNSRLHQGIHQHRCPARHAIPFRAPRPILLARRRASPVQLLLVDRYESHSCQ